MKVQEILRGKYENLLEVHNSIIDEVEMGEFTYKEVVLYYDEYCLYPPHEHADGWYFNLWDEHEETGPFFDKAACMAAAQEAIIKRIVDEMGEGIFDHPEDYQKTEEF